MHKVNTHRHEEGPVCKPAVQKKTKTQWVWASQLNDRASGLLSGRARQPAWWMPFICIWVMKKNKDRGVFLRCDRACTACVALPLPLSGIDVYIQPDWWICQSCVTPAVSEIVHLPPCKIALNWGNPSVAAPHGALINFTARRREPGECDAFTYGCRPSSTETTAENQPRKHFNPPPGVLILSYFSKGGSERFSHNENSYWLRRGNASPRC